MIDGIAPLAKGQSYTFLLQAGVGLLAASGAAEAAGRLPSWLVERPEYTDVLSMYVQSVAPKDPAAIAAMLTRMENARTSYDAQWLRLYSALGDEGQNGEFDALANNPSQRCRQGLGATPPGRPFYSSTGQAHGVGSRGQHQRSTIRSS